MDINRNTFMTEQLVIFSFVREKLTLCLILCVIIYHIKKIFFEEQKKIDKLLNEYFLASKVS